jgi:general secretion pathway protein K
VADLSPINVNTLLPHQTVLLSMLAPGRLARRRRGGAGDAPARRVEQCRGILGQSGGERARRRGRRQQQVQVRTGWFVLDISARVEQTEFFQTSLVNARLQPSKLVQRRWERDGADAVPLAAPAR